MRKAYLRPNTELIRTELQSFICTSPYNRGFDGNGPTGPATGGSSSDDPSSTPPPPPGGTAAKEHNWDMWDQW